MKHTSVIRGSQGLLLLLAAACSSRGTEGDTVKSTSLALSPALPCDARGAAITAVTGNVSVLGGVVDSYQSSVGSYGGGNTSANGNVVAKNSIFVQNGGVIRGTQTQHASPNMPRLSAPSNAINLPLGASQPGSVNINGSSSSLTLASGVYVVRDLNVNSPGFLNVAAGASVTVYVTNSLNLGGNLNANGLPTALTFVMTSTGAATLNSNGRLNGNIYAPASIVTLNSPVYGFVVGASVTLNQGASVHYDTLEACVNLPTTQVATTTDPTGGTVDFRVRLPSGEQIVRIIVRRNGVQVVDQDITNTEVPNGDGTSVYTYSLPGVTDGDQVDYRVYSKLPGGGDVYTPGPSQGWSTVCEAFDQCHAGSYDATLAKCVKTTKANGSACDDANACTKTDTCQSGSCTGTNPIVCTALDQCHSAGVCSPTLGCSNPAAADGTSCNDGNSCTTGDLCSVGNCSGTANTSGSNAACRGINQGLGYAPHQRHPLPNPPLQTGCFAGTKDGWVTVPCGNSTDLDHRHLRVSRAGVVVPPANQADVSYVFAQAETTIIHTDSQKNVLAMTPDLNDAWGLQVNTNSFAIDAATTGLLQFATVKFPDSAHPELPADTMICVYPVTWPTGTNKFDYSTHKCLSPTGDQGPPSMRAGKLRDFDYVNLGAYAYDDNSTAPAQHKLATVVQFSMIGDESTPDPLAHNQIPGLYAVVDADPGLAGHWWAANGGIMGRSGGSQAAFTNGEVLTTLSASNCVGDTTAVGATCPGKPQLTATNTNFLPDGQGVRTVESDNLTFIRNPALSFPNRNLVVTQVLASDNLPAGAANASCLATLGDDLFVKDNDSDNGGIPSNSGGVPFWESPDIFILPAGSPAPQPNDVAADFQVTLGQAYDVYLRVNNDFGCSDVPNLKVIIDVADPNLGLTNWSPVTSNAETNQFVNPPGNPTVPKFGRAIVGPFPWSPLTTLSGGHKCMRAAVAGGSQGYPFVPGTAAPWPDAFASHQIAQRNIQVTNGSSCDYSISNTSTTAANLLLGLNVTPSSSLAGSVITLTFDDDAAYDWFAVWSNQAARLPANTLSVAKGTGATPTTILTLNTTTLALDTVSVPAGLSPKVSIKISTTASPVPNVAISSRLEDPMFHTVLVENGGSCQASPALLLCADGLTLCNGQCVNLASDRVNCGSCGNVCEASDSCLAGSCTFIPT